MQEQLEMLGPGCGWTKLGEQDMGGERRGCFKARCQLGRSCHKVLGLAMG